MSLEADTANFTPVRPTMCPACFHSITPIKKQESVSMQTLGSLGEKESKYISAIIKVVVPNGTSLRWLDICF